MAKCVLVADDEPVICSLLSGELCAAGYEVAVAYDGAQAVAQFLRQPVHAAILDVSMPECSGFEALREIRRNTRDLPVILMTAFGSIKSAVEAMKMGADDYVTKPFDSAEILEKLQRLLLVQGACLSPSAGLQPAPGIIGDGWAMKELKSKIEKVKNTDATILITGESGTGKNVVAHTIHNTGIRRGEPFVHVDCTSLPADLIESELFGREEFDFFGRTVLKKGKFELAAAGTIFLDEISSLSPAVQPKLLNVLQNRCVERLGGIEHIPIRARIITATNENLEEAVQEHRFREDLYYRLNVIRLECPPLRVREDDLLELARYFMEHHISRLGKNITYIEDSVWAAFRHYSWPGNVRQLENTIQRLVLLADEPNILLRDLPNQIRDCIQKGGQLSALSLKEREFEAIISALENNGGHRARTAHELGISRRALQYKLKEFDLLDFIKERGCAREEWPPAAAGILNRNEMIRLNHPGADSRRAQPRVTLRTFGRFDVFLDGELVNFTSVKAKELLALCVDRNGGDVTMEEAIDKLWEDRLYDERTKNLYRKAVAYLNRTFKRLNCPEAFYSARGRCHVNRDAVSCDYFSYLDSRKCEPFTGEYLFEYSWAEETVARLTMKAMHLAEED